MLQQPVTTFRKVSKFIAPKVPDPQILNPIWPNDSSTVNANLGVLVQSLNLAPKSLDLGK